MDKKEYRLFWCIFPSGLSIKAIENSFIYDTCKKAEGTFEFIKLINENQILKYMNVI